MIAAASIRQVYGYSRLNRHLMTPGAFCRCFHCLHAFHSEQITQWVDEGRTAICPICGVDAVLSAHAEALSDALIRQLHATYFGASKRYTPKVWQDALAAEKARGRKVAASGA